MHICAWTGEHFSGKGYLLPTTDGPAEVVSEHAIRHALEQRVRGLEYLLLHGHPEEEDDAHPAPAVEASAEETADKDGA